MNRFLLTASAVVLASCSTAPAPSLQSGPTAEVTYDGLVPIDNSRFKLAYADPDVKFSEYKKVMPGGAAFEFRAVPKVSSLTARRSGTREFWISDADRAKLEQTVTEVFREEVTKAQGWEFVDEPGPDVLMIRGVLLDIVSYVPPEIVGRGEIYLSEIGEATLVVEAVDSMSGEVVYRGIERRVVETAGDMLREANTVTTWAEVRRWARRYGVIIKEGLEYIRAQEAG
ncbi:MAG: DUF3313 domain-containing protein [Gammaproteobacteria bacterium]|nr:DUF3313 domain-containing protein [Gammaproteobacteria bacterium]MDH4255269.1 DUF3313 domain-containing protein [Gammaproteobacteria bacterium]MDH5310001.1 DUF3313 domain-containing protein [Gammaproteobacteria bacterium]